MALVKTMATSTKLVDPGEDKHGSIVFFDVLGFFVVSYPHRIAKMLNWTCFVYVYFANRMMWDRALGKTDFPCLIYFTLEKLQNLYFSFFKLSPLFHMNFYKMKDIVLF